MVARTRTRAQAEEQRTAHMANAGQEAIRLCEQAAIRDIDAQMVCAILAQILAARNATLAGKVLMAMEMSIMRYPVKHVISNVMKADADLPGPNMVDAVGGYAFRIDPIPPAMFPAAELVELDKNDDGSYGPAD